MQGGLAGNNKHDALAVLAAQRPALILLTETHASQFDCKEPNLQGYDCISKPRPQTQQARRGPPRGGIAVFVADGFRQHVKEWKVAADGTYVILELAAGLLLADERAAYLAVCYVPPKLGRNCSLESFDDLQRDLAELPLDSPILTAGDMNAHTAGLTDLYPAQDILSDEDSDSDEDTEPEEWPENFLTVPRRNMQPPNTNNNHWGEEFIQYLQATGQAILNGRVPGDLTGKITRRDKWGEGSLLDYFAARAAVAKHVVSLQVLDDPSSLPVLCSDHNPVLLTLTGGNAEWAAPKHASPKGLCNIRYQVGGQEKLLTKLQADQQTASPSDCAAMSYGRILARVSAAAMDTFPQRKHHCQVQMPPWTDTEYRQLKQRLAQACRPMQVPASELTSLQHQVQGMRKHKRRNYLKANSAKLEAACRAGHQSFWTPFKVRKQSQCPVNAHAQLAYMQNLHGTVPAPAPVQLFPCELPAHRDPAPDATQLNADITAAEVESALRRAKRGKATGHDGLSADLLKDAAPALLDEYVHLFNLMLAGDIPDALSMGLITAVHKTGDKCDMANYRSITVTPPLKKVFDSVLECRLTAWTEEHGLRAATQAGFRPDQRTSDQHYVLHTLQDKYCRAGGQLHCCFVDFRKAFDTVPRDVLWAVLQSIGVGGRFLSCLQAMYNKDCAAVKTAEGLSEPFRCHQGVQQGSPLSPALFGIFVDALERLMQCNTGCHVPELSGHPVPLLLYADDLVLISRSAGGLQDLLHTLHQFATYRRLQVSIKKTEVLVFQQRKSALASLPTFHYDRKALKKVHQFKYLGLTLETQGGFREAIAQLCASARRAAFAVRHRCCRQGISSLDCILKLFNTKVLLILSYGCEVWFGNCCKDETKRRWAGAAEQVHKDFLRGILGVSRRAPTAAVLTEFGTYPLAVHWAKVAARFQKRAQCMEDDRPVRWAATYWGVPGSDTDVTDTENTAAAEEVRLFKESCTTPGLTLVPEYFHDVKLQEGLEPYLWHVKIASHRRALALLRLNCSQLRVCTDRIKKPKPPREERVCRLCSTGAVEDELHILTTCPAMSGFRASCPELQREHRNLASVFAGCKLRSLGWFAYQALQEHSRLLEIMGLPLWPANWVPQSNRRPAPRRRRRQ